tara:strand:- start:500 stop:766 length:267 start_codon:yes stop_codon:yes gene_type:complete
MRVSHNGIVRNGKRGGQITKLQADCKNYKTVTQQSAERYDTIQLFGLTEARPWIKADGPLCNDDAKHNTLISEQNSPLPEFHGVAQND